MLTHIIKERFDHEASKQALKEKYQAKMIFAHQGGWDEILIVAAPIILLFCLLKLANSRAKRS